MPHVRLFRAVLFDLGGTLVKTANVPETFRRILNIYGVKVSSDDVLKAHRENEKEFDVEEMVELGQDFWIRWNLKILERLGLQQNRQFLAEKIDEVWWEHADLEVYPDVIETLTQLRVKGMKIGIVTNGLEKDFQQILQKLELTDYFDVAVGIDSCNKAKPDREIFLYAVKKLHIRPEETIFIGDSLEVDYEGAKTAGLKPILLNRDGKTLADVKTITSLTELLMHL